MEETNKLFTYFLHLVKIIHLLKSLQQLMIRVLVKFTVTHLLKSYMENFGLEFLLQTSLEIQQQMLSLALLKVSFIIKVIINVILCRNLYQNVEFTVLELEQGLMIIQWNALTSVPLY